MAGYELDPFCVKHYLQLLAARNPIVCPQEGRSPTVEETMVFLRVCEKGSVGITSIKQRLVDWIVVGIFTLFPRVYIRAMEDIVMYVKECSSAPVVVNKEAGSPNGDIKVVENVKSMDEMLTLVAFLLRKTALSEKDIMTMPLGRAMWYSVAIATIDGAKLKVVSTEEEENAESDRQRLRAIQKAAEEELRLAMVNGQIPKRRINNKPSP